jgi:hypothetical protein
MIMGDNPAVSAGTPVCLAWKPYECTTCTVDDYESSKPEARAIPQMLLTATARDDILHNAGYSRQELQAAALQARKIRESRRKSGYELSYRFKRWIQNIKSSPTRKN